MVKKLTHSSAVVRKHLIRSLSSKRVSHVSFGNGVLSLNFNGRRLRNKVKIKHDPGMGNWARKKNFIYYDERIKHPDILPILVHEAVEKYIAQKFGLRTQSEAHEVAIAVEKKFISDACSRKYRKRCTHSGRCWRRHEQRIQGWWLAENAHRKKPGKRGNRHRRKGRKK